MNFLRCCVAKLTSEYRVGSDRCDCESSEGLREGVALRFSRDFVLMQWRELLGDREPLPESRAPVTHNRTHRLRW